MRLNPSSCRVITRTPFICADFPPWLALSSHIQQRRGISRNHLRKIKISENEWSERQDAIDAGRAQSVLEKLEERGYVNQIIGNRDELNRLVIERRVGVYCGVDPTAASLHIGHMVPFMALGWMYIHGYSSTFLLGGFTASIGDPTDRLTARPDQAKSTRKDNMISMFDQLKKLASLMERYAERRGYHREWAWRRNVINNNQWWEKRVTVKDLMKMLGKNMRMGPMLGRESVKNRLTKGEGMSYAEFSYPLIQGWDWWQLFQTGTQLQIGGADQYGNILAGAEAVKTIMKEDYEFKLRHEKDWKGQMDLADPMGFTVPLLTTSSGEKFGKSAGNAIWIDPQLTSSYDLYQFFLRTTDADVEKYLKLLTFLPLHDISNIMKEHGHDESKRVAQHRLAYDFVEMVHGLGQAQEAEQQHKQAFSKSLSVGDIRAQLHEESTSTVVEGSTDLHPSLNKYAPPQRLESSFNTNIKLPRSLVYQQPLNRILWSAGLTASRSEGQRLVNSGGVYVGGSIGKNNEVQPLQGTVTFVPAKDTKWSSIEALVIDNEFLLLRTGKWKRKFIQIVSDEEYEASGETCPGWKEDTEATSDLDLADEEKHRLKGRLKAEKVEQRRADRESIQSGGFGEVIEATHRKG